MRPARHVNISKVVVFQMAFEPQLAKTGWLHKASFERNGLSSVYTS